MDRLTTKSSKLDAASPPRLVRIDALWRNDIAEGFGFNFVGEDVQFVSNIITDLYESLKRDRENFESFLSELAPAQLLQAGKAHKLRLQGHRDKVLEQMVFLGVANVFILEQEKRLQADEFNGMVFTFSVPGRRGTFIDPELHMGKRHSSNA